MCDILRHRGPDDEGYLAVDVQDKRAYPLVGPDSAIAGQRIDAFDKKASLYLGHRRLSILDVSPAGHQPMCDRDGNVWIVFNGEIYNYIELKEELAKKGHTFRTSSDTEVLLCAYLEWGNDCLARLNGMWAFVIYDNRKNVLWGARDRFGVKPLYLYSKNGSFAFASEIKALVSLPFVPRRINAAAAYGYLAHGITNGPEGFFEGIQELRPAEAFSVDLQSGELTKRSYYRLQSSAAWERFDAKRCREHVHTVGELTRQAVRLRLRSDVPVGSCLSGGVDSSSIVCLVNQQLSRERIDSVGERQKVFTACYPGSPIDESRWAQMVADSTATQWHQTWPDAAGLLADLDDVVYHQDVPFGSSSIYAQYCVMRAARQGGVKVLLDGQGGDELFTGYTVYYANFLLDLIRHGALGALGQELRHRRNSPVAGDYLRLLARGCRRASVYRLLPPGIRDLLHWHAQRNAPYLAGPFAGRGRSLPPRAAPGPLSLNDMLVHMMVHSLPELLRYEDRNSMRFSIESRTPFADDIDLISYTFSVPGVYKIHHGWNKYLLRQAMVGVVPQPILERTDKIGFNTPEYDWLCRLRRELPTAMWSPGIDEFLDWPKLSADWDGLVDRQEKQGITTLWRYVNFALWKKRFGM
jgi:asparagine synthase (glutamine-hydrolysing)